jgi:general stress protein 26
MTISPLYGDPSATAPAWPEIERLLAEAPLYWLATTRRDGRPHVVPLCGLWHDGAFWFCTGEREQKSRNLEHSARVSVLAGHLGKDGWAVGKDVSVEGTATRVTDDALLSELAAGWLEKYDGDWRFEACDGLFHELSRNGDGQGDGAVVLRVTPEKVLVFGDAHGQTTYRP